MHSGSNRALSYGELVSTAAVIDPPDNPKLKSRDQFKLIGKPIPKLYTPAKTDGSAKFGIDVHNIVVNQVNDARYRKEKCTFPIARYVRAFRIHQILTV